MVTVKHWFFEFFFQNWDLFACPHFPSDYRSAHLFLFSFFCVPFSVPEIFSQPNLFKITSALSATWGLIRPAVVTSRAAANCLLPRLYHPWKRNTGLIQCSVRQQLSTSIHKREQQRSQMSHWGRRWTPQAPSRPLTGSLLPNDLYLK